MALDLSGSPSKSAQRESVEKEKDAQDGEVQTPEQKQIADEHFIWLKNAKFICMISFGRALLFRPDSTR